MENLEKHHPQGHPVSRRQALWTTGMLGLGLGAPLGLLGGCGGGNDASVNANPSVNPMALVSIDDNLGVKVEPFAVGSFDFVGGTISAPPNGTWYVGVELSSKQLRLLPRLGHRGWVPVGKVVTDATKVTSFSQITPDLPACRIPRTMSKLMAGTPINVIIMGSSLTTAYGLGDRWPDMIFSSGSTTKYRLPGSIKIQYAGVGGSPNKYQLAQLGFGSAHSAPGFQDSGFSSALGFKNPPNGRSQLFNDTDLVVISMLANKGDYRSAIWEPLIRKLRQRGVEVILVTDDPQNPIANYETLAKSAIYTDGPELIRLAELYGIELADTAAYVFEAYLRANGVGIYSDTIHMTGGEPTGPNTISPANGHEVWARSIRSLFSITRTTSPIKFYNYIYTFANNTENWTSYKSGIVTQSATTLIITKNTSTSSQWGAQITLPVTLDVGDTIAITATVTYSGLTPTLGMQNGGWASNVLRLSTSGAPFTGTLTATQTTNTLLLFANYDAALSGTQIRLQNVSLTVTTGGAVSNYDVTPDRPLEARAIPPVRMVSDLKTPADAYVILPKDEYFLTTNNTAKGMLATHPWGAASFSRRFSSGVNTNQDLLVLTAGKKAALSADCCVGLGMIYYGTPSDGSCVININVNGSLRKTATIAAASSNNEWWYDIFTPSEFNTTDVGKMGSAEIEVVSGTLKIAALVGLTADMDYIQPEEINYSGSWLIKENSRSGLPGYSTDTQGAYAQVDCTGHRLYWILSANPGSMPVDLYSSQEKLLAKSVTGDCNVRLIGGLVGTGSQSVRCAAANTSGSQSNGHALHVGGAIVVNDR